MSCFRLGGGRQPDQRSSEHQPVEAAVGATPLQVRPPERGHVRHGISGPRHRFLVDGELGEGAGEQRVEQLLLAAEERVHGRGRRAHALGDIAQRQLCDTRVEDNEARLGEQAVAEVVRVHLGSCHGGKYAITSLRNSVTKRWHLYRETCWP